MITPYQTIYMYLWPYDYVSVDDRLHNKLQMDESFYITKVQYKEMSSKVIVLCSLRFFNLADAVHSP